MFCRTNLSEELRTGRRGMVLAARAGHRRAEFEAPRNRTRFSLRNEVDW